VRITDYADRLIDGLEETDFIDKVKASQINWIGRSEGARVTFDLVGIDEELEVFTTRPDTLWGCTFMVLAPEHPFVEKYCLDQPGVKEYVETSRGKSDLERQEVSREKTGVFSGLMAINPATGKEVPIFISDYVLMSYGTGAIMAVPGHDNRDWEFARKFGLPVIEVVEGGNIEKEAFTDIEKGVMINSDFLNKLDVSAAKDKISKWLEEKGIGERKVNFKLRDWVFSRQRYWGEPIPLIHCEECGWVPVPEEELPLLLPEVESYEPSDNGESPLANITDWVEVTCPKCGGRGKRETDTMPQWAGSSWYFLRYTDPHNNEELASKENLDYWLPIDWYNGGMEHTTLHLLYSRFWHKFLYDYGVVPTPEPYQKRTSHGMILGENNEKMSKSRGNVVNPDEIISEFGADTLRLYEMFIGDFEKSVPWSQNGVKGCRRFLDRVWRLQDILVGGDQYSKELEVSMHKTIKKVSEDYETLKFNTAVAAMMSLINEFNDKGQVNKEEFKTFLMLLNPVAPHITEELWVSTGFNGIISKQSWPKWDESRTVEDVIEIAVQINGKVRGKMSVSSDATQEDVKAKLAEDEKLNILIEGKSIVKEIYVQGRIYNIVVK